MKKLSIALKGCAAAMLALFLVYTVRYGMFDHFLLKVLFLAAALALFALSFNTEPLVRLSGRLFGARAPKPNPTEAFRVDRDPGRGIDIGTCSIHTILMAAAGVTLLLSALLVSLLGLFTRYRGALLVGGGIMLLQAIIGAFMDSGWHGLLYSEPLEGTGDVWKKQAIAIGVLAIIFEFTCVARLDDRLFAWISSPGYGGLIGPFEDIHYGEKSIFETAALYVLSLPCILLFTWQWCKLRFNVARGVQIALSALLLPLYLAMSLTVVIFLYRAVAALLFLLLMIPIFRGMCFMGRIELARTRADECAAQNNVIFLDPTRQDDRDVLEHIANNPGEYSLGDALIAEAELQKKA